jgi:hypothetical protein
LIGGGGFVTGGDLDGSMVLVKTRLSASGKPTGGSSAGCFFRNGLA